MACLETRKLRTEELEEKLNSLARKGWKYRGTVNTSVIIFSRDILFPNLKDVL